MTDLSNIISVSHSHSPVSISGDILAMIYHISQSQSLCIACGNSPIIHRKGFCYNIRMSYQYTMHINGLEFRIANIEIEKVFILGNILMEYYSHISCTPHPIVYHATPLRRINVIVWPQNQRKKIAPFIYNPV